MLNLREIQSGSSCIVTWITGTWAGLLRGSCNLKENDYIRVVSNTGKGGVIICVHERRLALSSDLAFGVKVIAAA